MDDDDDIFISSSFGDFEKQENNTTSKLLIESQDSLYSIKNYGLLTDPVSKLDNKTKRYQSLGYEAHLDPVSAHELKQWQQHFHCYRVYGQSITETTGSNAPLATIIEEIDDDEEIVRGDLVDVPTLIDKTIYSITYLEYLSDINKMSAS